MTVNKSKWILASIWLVGAGLILLLMVLQSLMGYYGSRTEDAWGWYLPTVMPTLSLIIGVLVADFRAAKTAVGSRRDSGPLLGLSVGISLFYLMLVSLSILLQPLLPQTPPLELMQGLAAATLAAFFRGG